MPAKKQPEEVRLTKQDSEPSIFDYIHTKIHHNLPTNKEYVSDSIESLIDRLINRLFRKDTKPRSTHKQIHHIDDEDFQKTLHILPFLADMHYMEKNSKENVTQSHTVGAKYKVVFVREDGHIKMSITFFL
jgi:hypothetical protein